MILPLRTSMALVFGAILVVLSLALNAVIGSLASTEVARSRGNDFADLAQQVADKLDQDLYSRYRDVATVAALTSFYSPQMQNPQQARAWLDEIQTNFPLYAWIGFADLEGRVLVSTKGVLEGQSVAERPWFQAGQTGPYFGDVHKAKLLEKILPAAAEPWRFVDVAVPVKDENGQVVGVLGAHLSWAWAKELTISVLRPVVRRQPVEAIILGDEGEVLMGPPSLQNLKLPQFLEHPRDKKQYRLDDWPDGGNYLSGMANSQGYKAFNGLGWRVIVRMPTSLALASVAKLRQRILLSALAISLVGVLLVWLGAGKVTKPLRAISAAAERLRDGDHSTQMPTDITFREGRQLTDSLNSMLGQLLKKESELEDLNRTLEDQVDRRTQDLHLTLRALGASEHRLRTIADNMPVLICYIDRDQCYQFNNEAYRKWFNIDPRSLQGMALADYWGKELYSQYSGYIERALAGERVTFESLIQAGDDKRYCEFTYIPFRNTHGEVEGIYGMTSDITSRKQKEESLRWQLQHDPLTGALNRHGLGVILELAVARASNIGSGMAVLFIDLDHFKAVNDTHGHDAGDRLLKEVARRLMVSVRKTDSVARVAGDEFVVVLEGLTNMHQDAEYVTAKIHSAMQVGIDLGKGHLIKVTASIGGAMTDGENSTSDVLMKRADSAMYEAKKRGRNKYVLLPLAG